MADAIESALEKSGGDAGTGKSLRERVFQHFLQKAMSRACWPATSDAFCQALTVLYQT